jgi:hypothetical protein
MDLELMNKEDKRIKKELETELSRIRMELREFQKDSRAQKDETKQRLQNKDKEVIFIYFWNRHHISFKTECNMTAYGSLLLFDPLVSYLGSGPGGLRAKLNVFMSVL